jgi:drug/metabolite transporter (DMT)-like permease
MNWTILTLIAILSRSFLSLASKLLSKRISVAPVTQSVLMTGLASVLSFFLLPYLGGINFTGIQSQWVLIIIVMASQGIGNLFFYKGLEDTEASTAQVVFSSILIWSSLLSIFFLKTVFGLIQIIGLVLMLCAILTVQYQKKKIQIKKGSIYILFSAFFYALFQTASAGIASQITSGSYLLLSYMGPTLIMILISFKTIKKDLIQIYSQLSETLTITLFASGSSLGYFLFSFLAYKAAPDRGIVVTLLTSQVVVSVLLAIIFLGERSNFKRKLFAGLLAFIASVMIKS